MSIDCTTQKDIGRLMHALNCTSASDMNFKLTTDHTRYLKKATKGVREICRIIEDIAVISGLSLDEVECLNTKNLCDERPP